MPGFDGTGPAGMGPMTGGGRGFCRPRGEPGLRRSSFFRRMPNVYPGYGPVPYGAQMTQEEEIEFLKSESQALREELKKLEAEIERVSARKEQEGS